MTIKAVRMFDGGFISQPFAFGGEDGKDAFDDQLYYRSSLQNFVIDTGDEVILADTGFIGDFDLPPKKFGTPLYMGDKVQTYPDGLAALGYRPEQVTKILVTHKHPDHTDALKCYPGAKIYISPEDADAMKLSGDNVVRLAYKDGPYFEFPESEIIAPGVRMVAAKGHTKGNSVIIAESDGLFYMMHGDVTYCDAALKANKLSIATEDMGAARVTLDRVRAFIKARPTVYLSTHCPEGYESLELKRVMKL